MSGAATSVGTNSATLNGTVNPNGLSTIAWFQWGTTTNYGNLTTSTNVGSGTNAIAVSSAVSGLQSGTRYYYLLTASNSLGTVSGVSTNLLTPDSPRSIGAVLELTNGQITLQFTGGPNATYTVLGTTNIALPVSNWTVLGTATLQSSNTFQFSDTHATNSSQYYLLQSQ